MKLITWNINGIRSFKQPIKELLDSFSAEIICFQETKISRNMLESDIAIVEGYSSYYSFSKVRQGYSGVATYCRKNCTPFSAQDGFCNPSIIKFNSSFSDEKLKVIDNEGRCIITQHKYMKNGNQSLLTVINVYCPRADPEKPERLIFKLEFYKVMEEFAAALLKSGSDVIVCGDINTSHKPIDHRDPKDPNHFYDNPCRDWMDLFLFEKGNYKSLNPNTIENMKASCNEKFIDGFRYFHPKRKEAFTCWCTTSGCRATNYGTRIDYIFSNEKLACSLMLNCDIMPEVYGSDHCPVVANFEICFISSNTCPPICTKNLIEHGGKQQKLRLFFQKNETKIEDTTETNINNVEKQTHVSSNNNKIPFNSSRAKVKKNKQTKLSYLVKNNKKLNSSQTYAKVTSSTQSTNDKKNISKNSASAEFWKKVLKGPEPLPKCSGHNETSVLRTVKKEGPNCGKQFYCCARPEGKKNNPDARCPYFVWKS